jgi:hypothetical protein
LQRILASIDRSSVKIPLFVTLTYPADYPTAPTTHAAHLRAFRERLVRRYGKMAAVWRKEYQRRGAAHYHLLLFLTADRKELREFVSRAWYEVVGSGDERHLAAGTQVVEVKSWRGVRGYAAKYMGKLERLEPHQVPTGDPLPSLTGRLWGVWYRDLLPIFAESYQMTLRGFFRCRRVLRRLSGQRSRHQIATFSAFAEHGTVLKLLASPRYYP